MKMAPYRSTKPAGKHLVCKARDPACRVQKARNLLGAQDHHNLATRGVTSYPGYNYGGEDQPGSMMFWMTGTTAPPMIPVLRIPAKGP